MALVAYDYSDSGSENESDDDGDKQNDKPSVCELLFSSLPQPKQQSVIVEEDDDILLKPKKNGLKEPVKISIPALSNYNSDEEEPPKKIIIKPQPKATGLFAVLPTPKCVPVDKRNQKFDPSVVKQKNLVPRTVKKAAATKRQHDSDDEDMSISSSNFFSFTDTTKIDRTPGVSNYLSLKVDSAKPVKDINSKTNTFFSELVANSVKPAPQPEPEVEEEEETFEKKAVEELCGKRRKKGKKNDINFIDINAADVMPDPREWRTKALTEEQPQPAVKKGEEPSSQSRRKHQITYLAYQAKVNEQELKNQWALNRMTRKQTQAKYGF